MLAEVVWHSQCVCAPNTQKTSCTREGFKGGSVTLCKSVPADQIRASPVLLHLLPYCLELLDVGISLCAYLTRGLSTSLYFQMHQVTASVFMTCLKNLRITLSKTSISVTSTPKEPTELLSSTETLQTWLTCYSYFSNSTSNMLHVSITTQIRFKCFHLKTNLPLLKLDALKPQ